jgi:hypothetical protein
MKHAQMEAEIEDFLEGLNSDPPRHTGQWGPGRHVVEPALVVRRWQARGRVAPVGALWGEAAVLVGVTAILAVIEQPSCWRNLRYWS